MKTLGKLNINSEKIMKNEELLTLRGGYDGGWCGSCFVSCGGSVWLCGPACGPSQQWCMDTLESNTHYLCEGDYLIGCADYITC